MSWQNNTMMDNGLLITNKCTVLMVDDQRIVYERVKAMLMDECDIELHYCEDSTKALEMANQLKPTLILQDLVMPEVDGLTLVRMFRSNESTQIIPIIVLSTKEDPEDKQSAFQAGANDYLIKLPEKIEFVARIRAHSKSFWMQKERDEAFSRLRQLQEDLERNNVELEKLSSLDALTGVANRRKFDHYIHKEWKRARRRNSMLSIILIDVDAFKPFNDNYGHQAGDNCLVQVAQALVKNCRRPTDLLARYGGEEFIMVLPDTSLKGAVNVAEAMRGAISELQIPHEYSDVKPYLTISLGIACCEPSEEQAEMQTLIKEADKALYQAKTDGRDRYQISSRCLQKYQMGS